MPYSDDYENMQKGITRRKIEDEISPFMVPRELSEVDAFTYDFLLGYDPDLKITRIEPTPGTVQYELDHENYSYFYIIVLSKDGNQTKVRISMWENLDINLKQVRNSYALYGLDRAKEYYPRIIVTYRKQLLATEIIPHATSQLADGEAGTVIYRRNEQGQTVIEGGTINPGYRFEVGQNVVAIKPEIPDSQPAFRDLTQVGQDAMTAKPEKQKGRYRLTKDEIKTRKKVVKEAERLRRESDNKKTWKQIANELDIPERTLRAWRHNNY
jgi:hypothetical protein